MILDDIVKYRKIQLERDMNSISESEMKKKAEQISAECAGFGKALRANGLSVIAEAKKASPSKGLIQPNFDPVGNAVQYESAGAAAISCLTEEHYFMGSDSYLTAIKEKTSIPVLRKDFIISPYQIYQARVIGADAILLIAAILDTHTMSEYRKIAESLGMDVLAESHNEEEVRSILDAGCTIVGINNRNLKDFTVTLETTRKLASMIPDEFVKVSESGMKNNDDLKTVRRHGADAVLIGETLMRSGNIAESMKELLEGIE